MNRFFNASFGFEADFCSEEARVVKDFMQKMQEELFAREELFDVICDVIPESELYLLPLIKYVFFKGVADEWKSGILELFGGTLDENTFCDALSLDVYIRGLKDSVFVLGQRLFEQKMPNENAEDILTSCKTLADLLCCLKN